MNDLDRAMMVRALRIERKMNTDGARRSNHFEDRGFTWTPGYTGPATARNNRSIDRGYARSERAYRSTRRGVERDIDAERSRRQSMGVNRPRNRIREIHTREVAVEHLTYARLRRSYGQRRTNEQVRASVGRR